MTINIDHWLHHRLSLIFGFKLLSTECRLCGSPREKQANVLKIRLLSQVIAL